MCFLGAGVLRAKPGGASFCSIIVFILFFNDLLWFWVPFGDPLLMGFYVFASLFRAWILHHLWWLFDTISVRARNLLKPGKGIAFIMYTHAFTSENMISDYFHDFVRYLFGHRLLMSSGIEFGSILALKLMFVG